MPAESPDKQVPRSQEVFISYSRKDKEFVRRLDDELKRRDREAWVDWEGIPPGDTWEKTIYGAIESTHTFIFVLTPDSIASEVCGREIAHAAANNKRLVPIVHRDVAADKVPKSLGELNWIFYRESDDFGEATDKLISALDTDLKWVRAHTRVLTRAIEWNTNGRNKSFVLRGEDLRSAERWLAEAGAQKERQPTALQTEYILASRKEETRRQRIWRWSLTVGVVIALVLAALAWRSERKAGAQAKNARQTFSRSDFLRAADFLDQGGTLEALAYLSRAAETSPDNHAAADRIFNLLTQRHFCIPVTELKLQGEIGDVRFTSEGSCLIALVNGKTVQVWDAQKQHVSFPPLGHDGPVNHVRFSDDGKLLGVACGAPESEGVGAVKASGYGGKLLSVACGASESEGVGAVKASGYAQIWNAQTGKAVSGHLMHAEGVSYISFNKDASRMVSASQDRTMCIWDTASGKQVGPPLQHETPVQMGEFSGDGRQIVSVSGEVGTSNQFSVDGRNSVAVGGSLAVWNAETGTRICSPTIDKYCAISARFSPDGRRVAAVLTRPDGETHSEFIRLFDTESGKPLGNPASENFDFSVGIDGGEVTAMDSSAKSDELLVGYAPRTRTKDYEGAVLRWSWESGEAAGKPNDFKDAVDCVRFSPDAGRYVSTCADGLVRFWEASGEAAPGIEPLKPEALPRLAQFSPDGKRLLVISGDPLRTMTKEPANHIAEIYSIEGRPATGEFTDYRKQQVPAETAEQGVISPDGTRIIKDTSLYNAKTGQLLVSPLPLKKDLGENVSGWFAKFSPDGKCFVTGINQGSPRAYESGAARLWDGFTGHPLTEAVRHEEWVISASFSANSRMFLTIVARRENGVNCTPRIWDVATGRPLSDRFMRALRVDAEHGSGISADAAEFIEGGLRFRLTQEQEVQEEEKAQAQIWDVALPQDDDIPAWLPRLAKLIGGYELNKQSGIIEPVRDRPEGLRQLRDELAKAPADDPYVRFGRWVLSDPASRSISPYSKSSISPKQ